MPCLVFVEAPNGGITPLMVKSSDFILKKSYEPWQPNLDDFMTLSASELRGLLPEGHGLGQSCTKTILSNYLIENWDTVISGKTSAMNLGQNKDSGNGGSEMPPDDGNYDGDGGDEEGDSDEDDGNDPDDIFPFDFSDKTITVFTKLNFITPMNLERYQTITFQVRRTWKIQSLSLLLFQKLGICPNYFTYKNARGDNLWKNLSFLDCHVSNYDTIYVGLDLKGGGKRANNSNNVSSSNITSTARTKDDALNILEESLGVIAIRFNANPNASPTITALNQKITQLVQTVKADGINMETLLGGLALKDLDKLLHINDGSTKVPVKCKAMSDLCFPQETRFLSELSSQLKLANDALPLVIQFVLTHFYGEASGSISWSDLIDEVNKVIKAKVATQAEERARAQNAPANGLGI